MGATATHHRTVKAFIDRWRDRVARRIKARNPQRPPWDRQLFLEEFEADGLIAAKSADWYADAFEAAYREARGSAARFERELCRRVGA